MPSSEHDTAPAIDLEHDALTLAADWPKSPAVLLERIIDRYTGPAESDTSRRHWMQRRSRIVLTDLRDLISRYQQLEETVLRLDAARRVAEGGWERCLRELHRLHETAASTATATPPTLTEEPPHGHPR